MDVLNGVAVDTQQFSAHSTRAASTSAAYPVAHQWMFNCQLAAGARVNIHPILPESLNRQYGTGPTGFIPVQTLRVSTFRL